jgi:hypothetical protein
MSQADVADANVAAMESAKSLRQVYTTMLDAAIASQKRNITFTQSIFDRGVEEFKTHTDTGRDVVESIAQNTQSQRATFETLARQAVDVYMDYLHNVVSFYDKGLEAIRQATE